MYRNTTKVMRAKYSTEGSVLKILFELNSKEKIANPNGANMANDVMEIRLNDSLLSSNIHHDHLAILTILSVHPFVRDSLEMDLNVSQDFAKAAQDMLAYDVGFSTTNGQTYSGSSNSKPGLAFSGGVDSTAALMLMPDDTICAWLDRPQLTERTLYNKSAANYTMDFAENLGYEVHRVYCDVEHLRKPVGFPVDLTSGMAAVALASLRDIDSIAYGMVMEAAYRTGHSKYRDYPRCSHFKTWNTIFAAAGIPLFLPVAGVSEVGTSTIVLNSKFNGAARSCIRGVWPDPCNNCWKCFRKNLVDNRIIGTGVSDEQMLVWINVREVKYKLGSWPVSHENVLAWSLKNPLLSGKIAKTLLNRLEGSRRELDLLSRWYSPSIELIPEKYHNDFVNLVGKYLGTMDESEIMETKKLDIRDWLESDKSSKARSKFDKILNPVEKIEPK